VIVNKIWARSGSVAVVRPELGGCFVSSEFPTFTIDLKALDPRWMRWLTKTANFWAQCDKKSRGTSGKNRIRPEQFLRIEMPLPPLAEQQRIVALIEGLARRVSEAKNLHAAGSAETGVLVAAASRRCFSDTTWKQIPLAQCCEAVIDYRGRTPPLSERGVPHVTSSNIRNGRIDWNTSKFVSEGTYEQYMTRGIPEPGDVIFTMEAPLGEAACVRDSRRFSLAQRTLLLRGAHGLVLGEFLARALTTPAVREEIFARATGTTVKGMASKRLRNILLPIPSLPEQRRVAAYLDAVQSRTEQLRPWQAEIAAELDALLRSILDKALKGEL
jgi:type I restriction enzyme S subunit